MGLEDIINFEHLGKMHLSFAGPELVDKLMMQSNHSDKQILHPCGNVCVFLVAVIRVSYLNRLHSGRWRVQMLCVEQERSQPTENKQLGYMMPAHEG